MIKSEEYYKNILNSPTEEAKKLTILSYLDKTYNSFLDCIEICFNIEKRLVNPHKPFYRN